MQDQNHKQDRLTLKFTTLIFILCFLGPVIYSAITGKCLLNTCALKLENLKSFVTEKGKEAFSCPFSSSKEQPPAKTCTLTGNISPVIIKADSPLPPPVSASSSDTVNKPESQTAAIDENQKKTFNISG